MSAVAVPVIVLLNQLGRAQPIPHGDALDLRNIGPSSWDKVVTTCRATDLTLYHVMVSSLSGIDALRTTVGLSLTWAPKLTSLTPLFEMKWLRRLSISDVAGVRNLEGIDVLTELVELHLSGNRAGGKPRMDLLSIRPVSELRALERFSLENARLLDDDITPLARIATLRHLGLSNQFDRTQFAYLAKHLNHQLEEPILAYRRSSTSCKKCGAGMVLVTGRRMPFLCKSCDRERLERHELEFDRLIRAA